jgi:hypothetical protein
MIHGKTLARAELVPKFGLSAVKSAVPEAYGMVMKGGRIALYFD